MSGVWTEPVRGSAADYSFLALPGLDRIRWGIERQSSAPPIHHLFGLRPTEAAEGTAVFTMPASGWLQSAAGVFLGGTLALVADAPLGSAIMTALGPGSVVVTSEMSMSFLRPASMGSGNLVAKARLVHLGRSLGLSEVLIEDSSGRLLGHGSSRCFIRGFPIPDGFDSSSIPVQKYDTPSPFEREPYGTVLAPQQIAAVSGLDLVRAYLEGEFPPPPIANLTGLRPVEASEGEATWSMPASPWLMSPAGTIYGGAIAFLADASLLGAVQTVAPAGAGYATLDFKVHFLRPAVPDGTILTAKSRIVHRGKTLAVANSDIRNSEGKSIAVATGSAVVLEGRMTKLALPLVPEDEASDE